MTAIYVLVALAVALPLAHCSTFEFRTGSKLESKDLESLYEKAAKEDADFESLEKDAIKQFGDMSYDPSDLQLLAKKNLPFKIGGFVPKNHYELGYAFERIAKEEAVAAPASARRVNKYHLNGLNDVCQTEECKSTAEYLKQHMNLSANPCTNMHEFTCGNYRQHNPRPKDTERWGVFDRLDRETMDFYRDSLAQENNATDSQTVRKTRELFKFCNDITKRDAVGTKPVTELLNTYGGWPLVNREWTGNGRTPLELVADVRRDHSVQSAITVGVGPFLYESDKRILQVHSTKLGLPGSFLLFPNFYHRVINPYRELIRQVALRLGAKDDDTLRLNIYQMVEVETLIARAEFAAGFESNYPNQTVAKVESKAPGFKTFLNRVLTNTTQASDNTMVLPQTNLFIKLNKIIRRMGNDTKAFHNFVLWRLVQDRLPLLGSDFETLLFDFYNTVSQGQLKKRPRNTFCTGVTSEAYGFGMGRLFVDAKFKPAVYNTTQSMVEDIRTSFIDLLQNNTWLDESHKVLAAEKAKAIKPFIGYPQWMLNNDELDKVYQKHSNGAGFFEAIENIWKVENDKEFSEWFKPADKDEWLAYPGVVNAFYMPIRNSITFPAGILQDPFYLSGRPEAMNFGAIGMVIGHEITHGFDNSGRQFDKDGNYRKWWNDAMIKEFQTRSQCYVKQYSTYCHELTLGNRTGSACVNGEQTLGENIADNGGMKQAYYAYRKWVKEGNNGKEEKRLPGLEQFSGDQLVFIGMANIWCGDVSDKYLYNQIMRDPHAPGRDRVIGTMANSNEFQKAFNCPPRPDDQETCELW